MVPMKLFDWNRIWNDEMVLTGRIRLNDGEFWNGMAVRNQDASFTHELTEKQIALIAPSTNRSVLEIGPGQGRLTVPLAKLSSRVTAVDPSGNMVQRLRERAAGEGAGNIIFLNVCWENLLPEMLHESPDIILASYSLFMTDMAFQLKRMNDLAGEKVILFVPGEPRTPPSVRKILYGTETVSGKSDHVILFNLLYDLGIDANVEMMGFRSRKEYDSVDRAVKDFAGYHNAPEEKIPSLAEYLCSRLIKENGKYILEQDRKTAALWWWSG